MSQRVDLEAEGTVHEVETPFCPVGAIWVGRSPPLFGTLEKGQDALPPPARISHLFPLFVVFSVASVIEHSVYHSEMDLNEYMYEYLLVN